MPQIQSSAPTPENEREHAECAGAFRHIGKGSRLIAPIFVDYGIHVSIGEDTFYQRRCNLFGFYCYRYDW